jgi:hypothetical protein
MGGVVNFIKKFQIGIFLSATDFAKCRQKLRTGNEVISCYHKRNQYIAILSISSQSKSNSFAVGNMQRAKFLV